MTTFLQRFNRPSADLTSTQNITSRANCSFDLHERLYSTLGEQCQVLDVDDTVVESFASADGLPFVAVEAPQEATHAAVQQRFVCATTKAVHVYRQHDPDEAPRLSTVDDPCKKVPLASISVVGAVPISQRILSLALFGTNQDHVVVLTTHQDGCVFVYNSLVKQISMHPGDPDQRWGTRTQLGSPGIVCGSPISDEIAVVHATEHRVVCYEATGQEKSTWLKYSSNFAVTAATVDRGNRLNIAFRATGGSASHRVDVYGVSNTDASSELQLLWRFKDDGIAPFGIPVAICVGGANNIVVLDDRDIPYPNCISWDHSLVQDKLKQLKLEENNDRANQMTDEQFGYRPHDDAIVFPINGTGGAPTTVLNPLDYVHMWKNGGLRARVQDTNAIVASTFVVRMKRRSGRAAESTSVSSSSSSSSSLSMACACRLVRDDGHTTTWKQTKYVRCLNPTAPGLDSYYEWEQDAIHFEEEEVIGATGYVVQMELRGRSGLDNGVLGSLILPATCLQTVPPNEMQQQFNMEVNPHVNETFETGQAMQYTFTLLVDLFLEPSMLSIKNSYSKQKDGQKERQEATETIETIEQTQSPPPTTNETVEFEVNRQDHATTTSSKIARVDTPTILFGKRSSEPPSSKPLSTPLPEQQKQHRATMPPVLVPTPPSSGASPVRFQRQIITPYTPRDPVSEEIETIRELIQALTTTAISKQRGAVWTVGSTGGNKLRAYMSLRNLVLATTKLKTLVGQEMSGIPLTMALSDLGCGVKRIRCAAALLLLALVEHHRANQRLLRRSPGFTILCKKQHLNEKNRYCRVFWAPLKLRGEYIGTISSKNQLIEARNNGKVVTTAENSGGLVSPQRRRKLIKPTEFGFMKYLKHRLAAGIHLDATTTTTNDTKTIVQQKTVVENEQKILSPSSKNAGLNVNFVKTGSPPGGRQQTKQKEEILKIGNKGFAHAFPTSFVCYPAARLYRKTMVPSDSVQEQTQQDEEQQEHSPPPSIDQDGALLDWCPDPAEHLLAFPVEEPTSTTSTTSATSVTGAASIDTDNIVEMVHDARLRFTFDQLGRGAAVPFVAPEDLKKEPLFCALMGGEAVDALVAFFVHQRKKDLISWADVCEYRRFHKYSSLSRQQIAVEASFLKGKPILLKKFKAIKICREREQQQSSSSNRTELLTNASVWADTAHNRLYIDVTLHPSDGSKYRVYIQAPPALSPTTKVDASNNVQLLTLPLHTLETLTTRLLFPSTHALRTALTTKFLLKEEKQQALQATNTNCFKSMATLPLVQIKLGGGQLRPKAMMNKYSTIRKVLRAALVLGKSLWQQSRVEDAFQLMQRAVVRAIEVMPCKSDRTTQEDQVLLELFRIAKRAKLVGRRDPAMSVMLYRSTFSECLLKLLGRAIPKEQKEKFRVMNRHTHDTQQLENHELDQQILKENQQRIKTTQKVKQDKSERKEKEMNAKLLRRQRIKKEESNRRQDERIKERKKRLALKQAYEEAAEKDEDLWYGEGKRLEQLRLELEKVRRDERTRILTQQRKERKEQSLKKRKEVEQARVAAIELKAKSRGQKTVHVGIDDGRLRN